MKKFLIAGSSLAAVAAAGSAGAVDVTLGGSIDMGIEYGVGKNKGNISFGSAFGSVSLSIAAAGSTDAGMKYGGSFSLATAEELEFDLYNDNGVKKAAKYKVKNFTDLQAAAYNVSGGQKIDPDDIVAVKINSDWNNVSDNTRTVYGITRNISGAAIGLQASNVCKVAGRAHAPEIVAMHAGLASSQVPAAGGLAVARMNAAGTAVSDIGFIGDALATADTDVANDGYLPAGRLAALAAATNGDPANADKLAAELVLTAGTSAANSGNVFLTAPATSSTLAEVHKGAAAGDVDDLYNVYIANIDAMDGAVVEAAPVGGHFAAADFNDADDAGADVVVEGAAVFAGPYMEVKLASSTTKMVVGAVCVTGTDVSNTAMYLNNSSRVVTASAASIFVEGGFGKLTAQTSDYAGKVSAIGDAGDAAEIDANGLVVIAEGVGLIGANPYFAADLSGSLDTLEIMTGGSIEMGGLTATVDAKLGNGTDILSLSTWDLGLAYTMGDMEMGFALDSDNDWGLKTDMELAGLSASATVYSKAATPHKKSGLFYDISLSTKMDNMTMKLGVNQDMKPSLDASYDMGGLNLYAGYSAADEGGKMGAKLSF